MYLKLIILFLALKKSKINKNDKISLYLQIVDIYSVLGQIVR